MSSNLRQLLILSPHFPPVNAPDMHRVRLGVRHYRSSGWNPVVLAVDPAGAERGLSPRLVEGVPADLEVVRVPVLSSQWSSHFGIRGLAYRSFVQLGRRGLSLLRARRFDLVFASTTMFPLMGLAKLWRRRVGVPYVLDFQDPWALPRGSVPPGRHGTKHALARELHRQLESLVVPHCAGLMAVSEDYLEALSRRYPVVEAAPRAAIPFGFDPRDFELAEASDPPSPVADLLERHTCAVYVGVLGDAMQSALTTLLESFALARERAPELFANVRLLFLGTSYAGVDGRPSARPIAERYGIGSFVVEHLERMDYFQALSTLRAARLLLLPTVNDPGYRPSKLYSVLFAQRPVMAVLHPSNPLLSSLQQIPTVAAVGSGSAEGRDRLADAWASLLRPEGKLDYGPHWRLTEPYKASHLAKQHTILFDQAYVYGRRW